MIIPFKLVSQWQSDSVRVAWQCTVQNHRACMVAWPLLTLTIIVSAALAEHVWRKSSVDSAALSTRMYAPLKNFGIYPYTYTYVCVCTHIWIRCICAWARIPLGRACVQREFRFKHCAVRALRTIPRTRRQTTLVILSMALCSSGALFLNRLAWPAARRYICSYVLILCTWYCLTVTIPRVVIVASNVSCGAHLIQRVARMPLAGRSDPVSEQKVVRSNAFGINAFNVCAFK